jgi:chemotaxis protein histidine kinase CheA
MMRVPVKQLDNVSNLVGELVVYRNTLEQAQDGCDSFWIICCIKSAAGQRIFKNARTVRAIATGKAR